MIHTDMIKESKVKIARKIELVKRSILISRQKGVFRCRVGPLSENMEKFALWTTKHLSWN